MRLGAVVAAAAAAVHYCETLLMLRQRAGQKQQWTQCRLVAMVRTTPRHPQ